MRFFDTTKVIAIALIAAFLATGGAQAALQTGPFQTCQTSPLTLTVNGSQLDLSDGTTFTAPAAIQPTGDFSLQMVPGRVLRAIENQADLSCPGGSRIWLYRVPTSSGQPLVPIVAGLCLQDRLAAECYYSGAASGSPQRIAAFTEQRGLTEHRLTWVDMTSGQSATSIHNLVIDAGSLRFGPSGTVAMLQHDLFNGPGFSDRSVIDLCPDSLGTRLANVQDAGAPVSAQVVEPSQGNYAARVTTPAGDVDVSLVDCLAGTPPAETHTLAVDTNGNGFGQVEDDFGLIRCPAGLCSADYARGTVVTLAALPMPRSHFVGWSGDCSGSNPAISITLDADRACTATFERIEVDLGVTATAMPDPAVPGTSMRWTVRATNHSLFPSTSTRVRAVLPPELSFDAAASSAACQPSGNAIACVLTTLAPQATQTFDLVAEIDPDTRADVAADFTISGVEPDPVTANDTAMTLTGLRPEVDLEVTKRGPANAAAGDLALWQVEVRNDGPSSALTPSVVDPLPPELTLLEDPAASQIGCTPQRLAPGATYVQTLITRVDENAADGTAISNLASASALETDLDPSNDSSMASLTVAARADDPPGTLRRIARQGEQPAGTRQPYGRFWEPAIDGELIAFEALYPDNTRAIMLQADGGPAVPLYDAGQVNANGTADLRGGYSPSLDGGRVLATALDIAGGAQFYISSTCGPEVVGGFAGFEGTLQDGRVAYLDDPDQGLAGVFLYDGGVSTRLVSRGDPMPGSGLAFNFFSIRPALDAPYVSFWGYGPGSAASTPYGEGVFVWDDQGGLRVIADRSTPVPEGQGTFARIYPEITISGGTIFFFGEDADGHGGLYAADAATGVIVRLVDRQVPVDGESFTLDRFFLYPSAAPMSSGTGSGTGVVFYADSGDVADGGLYLWQDGLVRRLVASGTSIDDYIFGSMRIGPEAFDGQRVVFQVSGFDVSAGQLAFYESVWTYVVGSGSTTPPPSTCSVDDFEDGSIDSAWTLFGLGNANQEAAVEAGGELALTADGATAFFGADNAGYLYQTVSGDFRFEATVDGHPMTTGGPYRKAGLMVRTGLDPWDIRLLALLAPYWLDADETHLQFVARESYGSPGRLPVARDVIGVPRVVRLAVERVGDEISVEYSIDGGQTWTRPTTGLGGSITIPALPETLYVGLAMVSNDISVTSTASFDDASLCLLP